MRATSVGTGTCASLRQRRSDTRPSAVGCQPVVSISPSAATSAATTRWPVVPGERAALRVDDRAARPDRGRPMRYAWPLASDVYAGPCRIWIDQARSTRRQSAMPTSDREPADPHEEARAAEERRVRARVRLEPAAAGEVARERDPAPGIGGRDGYGSCGWSSDTAEPGQCRDRPGAAAIRRRARPRAGRAPKLRQARSGSAQQCRRRRRRSGGRRPRARARPAARASRRSGRVELGREPLGRDGVEVELAVRVAAGREHEHRAPPRGLQLVVRRSARSRSRASERDEQLGSAGRARGSSF